MIYFVLCEDFVKIGKTKDIKKRLNSMQVGNPYTLELLFEIEEDILTESIIHGYFKKKGKHHRREWFIYDLLTEEVIHELQLYKQQKDKILKRFEIEKKDIEKESVLDEPKIPKYGGFANFAREAAKKNRERVKKHEERDDLLRRYKKIYGEL